MDVQKALATQISNIEARKGKTLDPLRVLVQSSGLATQGGIVGMLKRDVLLREADRQGTG